MTPEREAQLFAKLDLLLELQRRTDQDMREMRAELRAEMSEMQTGLRSEMQQLREALQDNSDRVSRLEGRAEEQSKMLQLALASRQPRRAAG